MLFLALSLAFSSPGQAADEKWIESTLAQLSIEEKVDLLAGVDGFFTRDIPRLGVPRLRMSDGPVGVRNYGPTTAYPAGVALAATWNEALAQSFGHAIGRDARSRGVHIWLGPGVNLSRVPQNGRNFEYVGEDPFLAGRFATGIVQGVQKEGVVATVKHYAGNEHEDDRNQDDSQVDERVLRELYLRPFEAAVKEGGVQAVMCGYNRLNGPYCSENAWLLDTVLRKDWGFRGLVMSDWGAVHSALGAAQNGMDLEMPGPDFMNRKNLLPKIADGTIKVATIDEKVRRLLRVTEAMSFRSRPQLVDSIPKDDPTSRAAAMAVAREGVVLLKNQGNFLPLSTTKRQRILVVGPNAEAAVTGGGGSSYTTPTRSVSNLQAIRQVAGPNTEVVYKPVLGEAGSAAFRFDGYDRPFKAEYFANRTLSGTPAATMDEPKIDHNWTGRGPVAGVGARDFSVRWTGSFTPKVSGSYMFVARSDDGIRVSIDDRKVIDAWYDHGVSKQVASINLPAGKPVRIQVEYYQGFGEAIAQFGLVPLTEALDRDLPKDEVGKYDAVIACVGLNGNMEGEGFDRSFELPGEQQILLSRLLESNRRVVIVNNSGAGVDLAPFAPRAAAIIQAWYLGGEGNEATADVLFGRLNPSGKLPTTFPRTLKGTYYETAYPSNNRIMPYREGLFIGYRWFDANRQAPLFPFGFGLSYTTFKVSDLSMRERQTGRIDLTVSVTNTGRREGAETVQVYVGKPKSAVKRVVRELKAFTKVNLRPGETRRVTLSIARDCAAYWDVAKHDWVNEPGRYDVAVGTSSRDLPLSASFVVN